MNNKMNDKSFYSDIVIVGAGVAGTSTLHHLLPFHNITGCNKNKNIKSIVIVDAGTQPGRGFDDDTSYKDRSEPQQQLPRYSGTAVFMHNVEHDSLNITPVNNNENEGRCSGGTTGSTASAAKSILHTISNEHKIIKMMVQIFACPIETFISHHGINGAQTYLSCTKMGLQIQKSIAQQLTRARSDGIVTQQQQQQSKNCIIHELGSLYLAYEEDVDALRKEYNRFVSLGADLFDRNGIEWYEVLDVSDDPKNTTTKGNILTNLENTRIIALDRNNQFYGGIFFPNDAIIDSSRYSQLLVQNAADSRSSSVAGSCTGSHNNNVRSIMNTIVTHIERLDDVTLYPKTDTSNNGQEDCFYSAIVTCYDRMTRHTYRIYCRHVIIATGGVSVPQGCVMEDLYGILKPCYSYLAHVPMQRRMEFEISMNETRISNNENGTTDTSSYLHKQRSPNFFTWNFTHDWCYTDGYHVRISGEDHYSARKDSKQLQRCHNLIHWTYELYNRTETTDDDDESESINKGTEMNDGRSTAPLERDWMATIPQQSGIYTETPDYAPIVGCIASDTNQSICYIVGCNAWGQTILSYAATLIPPILGYRPMTVPEQNAMSVLSIQRFTHSIVNPADK